MKKINAAVVQKIASKSFLFLFLDYDGTLTSVATGPSTAKLSPKVKALLRELTLLKNVKAAIVSGRPLENLRRYARIPGLIHAGNHGFEIKGPGISYLHSEARAQKNVFAKLARDLKRELPAPLGFLIEHKTFSISVHYGQARSLQARQKVKSILTKKAAALNRALVSISPGKDVWEIKPAADWHKGKAILWLLARYKKGRPFFPVYIGDDLSDEKAFAVIKKIGIGIKVTAKKYSRSYAPYFVRSSGEVVRFLRTLVRLKTRSAI